MSGNGPDGRAGLSGCKPGGFAVLTKGKGTASGDPADVPGRPPIAPQSPGIFLRAGFKAPDLCRQRRHERRLHASGLARR